MSARKNKKLINRRIELHAQVVILAKLTRDYGFEFKSAKETQRFENLVTQMKGGLKELDYLLGTEDPPLFEKKKSKPILTEDATDQVIELSNKSEEQIYEKLGEAVTMQEGESTYKEPTRGDVEMLANDLTKRDNQDDTPNVSKSKTNKSSKK